MARRVTAAATPIEFANGKKYQFSPLSDRDIDELDEWVQAKVVENARNSLQPNMSQRERDETLRVALETSITVTWLSGIGSKLLATPGGMARLAWQSIRKQHPEVTYEEFYHLMVDPANIEKVRASFEKVNLGAKPVNPQQARAGKR